MCVCVTVCMCVSICVYACVLIFVCESGGGGVGNVIKLY